MTAGASRGRCARPSRTRMRTHTINHDYHRAALSHFAVALLLGIMIAVGVAWAGATNFKPNKRFRTASSASAPQSRSASHLSQPNRSYRTEKPGQTTWFVEYKGAPRGIEAPKRSEVWITIHQFGFPARALQWESPLWYDGATLHVIGDNPWARGIPVHSWLPALFDHPLPIEPNWTGLIIDIVFWGTVWESLRLCTAPLRAWRRRRTGLCEACGYSLLGLPAHSHACPECGSQINPSRRPSTQRMEPPPP